MREIEYRHTLKPSVEFLAHCGTLMIDSKGMAEFLHVPSKAVTGLVDNGRIPFPCQLGLGKCLRWSLLELLEWVEAGCPRRRQWMKMRGSSGWCRR